MAITKRNTIKKEILINERFAFNLKKFVYKEKGFTHTEKRFVYIHKTNPRQNILTANSCGKFPRHISRANNQPLQLYAKGCQYF